MSGTLVPISENLGTGHIKNCGYRVPARKKFWEPMGIGYQPENFFWVLHTGQIFNDAHP